MSQPYATFRVADLHFAIGVSAVQEVIRHRPLTPVPLAPHAVAGILNLRGEIVTAIDMRRQLGLAARRADRLPMHVVVRTTAGAVSLLVDEVDDVLELDRVRCEDGPAPLRGPIGEAVIGMGLVPGKLVLVLDAERTVRAGAREAADGQAVSLQESKSR
jgi:purine-binding chemotaxis protein CheW